MTPAPGTGRLLFEGEVLQVRLESDAPLSADARAFLRTDLNTAAQKRRQVIARVEEGKPLASTGWHNVQMERVDERRFEVRLIAYVPGYYELKGFVQLGDEQHWVEGPNASVSIHPLKWRKRNILYCAFPRQFGPFKEMDHSGKAVDPAEALELDRRGFVVIPPSGTFDDLAKAVPFLIETLGVRVIHLLPVQDWSVFYGRMGRFGSPYAATDLTSIHHAYCTFDTKRTPDDQFRAFCAKVHAHGGELILDVAINHVGWSSELLNSHPEWFLREADGSFKSPGAWGVVWGDLVEFDFTKKDLWRYIADGLLLWCDRGVDGFRCDAGYKVPEEVWEYVTARVHEVFPDTLFLLEGLGGSWDATERLLRAGAMQWAYSEIFQNIRREDLESYLRHHDWCSSQYGILAHYAETHDNERLASKGSIYARMRLALAALASYAGCFGFTAGAEWLATERVKVHGASGLRWGKTPNLVDWIKRLSRILSEHPAFRGVARLEVLPGAGDILSFVRTAENGAKLLVIAHLGSGAGAKPQAIKRGEFQGRYKCLLTQRTLDLNGNLTLAPGEVLCLDLGGPAEEPKDYEELLRLRAIVADLWGAAFRLDGLADLMQAVQEGGLCSLLASTGDTAGGLAQDIRTRTPEDALLSVSRWTIGHSDRVHLMSETQFLVIELPNLFRARIVGSGKAREIRSFPDFRGSGFVAYAKLAPGSYDLRLSVLEDRASPVWRDVRGRIEVAPVEAVPPCTTIPGRKIKDGDRFLLTSEDGSYSMLPLRPGTVESKYDALLAINPDPVIPSERLVLVKRLRCWLRTPLYSIPLDSIFVERFESYPTPTWHFAFEGDFGQICIAQEVSLRGRSVGVRFYWHKLPEGLEADIIVRPDLELRSHHAETKAYTLDERAFAAAYVPTPVNDGVRREVCPGLWFRVQGPPHSFHMEGEWKYSIAHPHEATRGQEALGDAFSPGYFKIPLDPSGGEVAICFGVEESGKGSGFETRAAQSGTRSDGSLLPIARSQSAPPDFLLAAARQFLARRDGLWTVIAGYPWFLDWGRDSLIAARGYLSAGMTDVALDIASLFASLERDGTVPNALFGRSDSNRESSDAPLWLLVLLDDLERVMGWKGLVAGGRKRRVDLPAVAHSILQNYMKGTPTGVRMDERTGLIYSPAHYTWMDTNYPACTPRNGYPVEIQALWAKALRFGTRVLPEGRWEALAAKVEHSIGTLFWIEHRGYFADVLQALAGESALGAPRDSSLRPNQLYLVAFDIVAGRKARKAVQVAAEHLLAHGGLRSLANLPLARSPFYGMNPPDCVEPLQPYRGRYEGDEDRSRKPAYHNGTIWTHLLPLWVEALLRAFPGDEKARQLGRAILHSLEDDLWSGCVGQLCEIRDGDAPHRERGAFAQAWAVTETLRLRQLIEGVPAANGAS